MCPTPTQITRPATIKNQPGRPPPPLPRPDKGAGVKVVYLEGLGFMDRWLPGRVQVYNAGVGSRGRTGTGPTGCAGVGYRSISSGRPPPGAAPLMPALLFPESVLVLGDIRTRPSVQSGATTIIGTGRLAKIVRQPSAAVAVGTRQTLGRR